MKGEGLKTCTPSTLKFQRPIQSFFVQTVRHLYYLSTSTLDISWSDSVWLDALRCSWLLLTLCFDWYSLSHDPTAVHTHFCHVHRVFAKDVTGKRGGQEGGETARWGDWEAGTSKCAAAVLVPRAVWRRKVQICGFMACCCLCCVCFHPSGPSRRLKRKRWWALTGGYRLTSSTTSHDNPGILRNGASYESHGTVTAKHWVVDIGIWEKEERSVFSTADTRWVKKKCLDKISI